jgi:hypothetical protein
VSISTSQFTSSEVSSIAQSANPTPTTTTRTISKSLPLIMESWPLPYVVNKILALRNTSCLPFEPSNYPVTTSIRKLPKSLCPLDNLGSGDLAYERYEDACLGAYCAYAIDSAMRSYYTLNTSKPIWTSTRLVPSAIYDDNSKIVGYSTLTRIATCKQSPTGIAMGLADWQQILHGQMMSYVPLLHAAMYVR